MSVQIRYAGWGSWKKHKVQANVFILSHFTMATYEIPIKETTMTMWTHYHIIHHLHKAAFVFIFLSSNSISCVQWLGLFESLSIATLNTRKPPTEAESKTFKSGLTYWTLDLTVKQLSEPICLPSCMAMASQLLRKCMNRRSMCFSRG